MHRDDATEVARRGDRKSVRGKKEREVTHHHTFFVRYAQRRDMQTAPAARAARAEVPAIALPRALSLYHARQRVHQNAAV
jgi:hypothetical protein